MSRREALPALFSAAALSLWACAPESESGAGSAGEDRQSYEISQDSRYIVHFADDGARASLAAEFAARGDLAAEIPGQPAAAVYLDERQVAGLLDDAGVERIEPDPRRTIQGAPATTGEGDSAIPAGVAMVGAPELWDTARGTEKRVCVVDSGYDMGHESLPRARVTGDSGAAAQPWDADSCGHGTHVAGTLAALDNDRGPLGLLPDGAVLHVVKAFGAECQFAYASEIVEAVTECRRAGADIVNMSFGGAAPSEAEKRAFAELYDDGALLVAAAGNRGEERAHFPASYESVISVAAVDRDETRAPFSNYGENVELAAPGVGVRSTAPMDGCLSCDDPVYTAMDGTSMAAPHVSGVAALVWGAQPDATNEDIRDVLAASARELGPPGRDPYHGHGLVRAPEALEELRGHCAETGCAGDRRCDEASGQCVGDIDTLAFYDFADDSARPLEADADAGAGPLRTLSGSLQIAAEGAALDRGFRDQDENAFVIPFDPGPDGELALTDLHFQERPSDTGPSDFEIEVVDEGSGEIFYAGEGQTDPGAWSDHRLFLGGAGAGPYEGAVEIRIRGGGAATFQGTWRVDNVHIEGRASAGLASPEIVSEPPESVRIGHYFRYAVEATGDPEPSISVDDLPWWMFFDGIDTIRGTPPPFALGETDPIVVRATNGEASATEQTFTVDVEPMWPFSLSGPDTTADFGSGLPDGWYASGDWEAGPAAEAPIAPRSGAGVAATGIRESYRTPSHSVLTSPAFDLEGVNDPIARFESWFQIDGCYHGVNVLVSTDGGRTFDELAPGSVSPGYDGEVAEDAAGDNALAGQRAWCGESGGWQTVEVDLDHNLGAERDRVMLKLQLGADNAGARSGWYIDDFRIGAATDMPRRSPTVTLALFDFEGGSKSAARTASAASAEPFDDRDGRAEFVLGNPGRAITSDGFDDGENYFEATLRPDAGARASLTGVTFHERPSAAGPQALRVFVDAGGDTVELTGEPRETVPGAWRSRAIRANDAIELEGEARVRFVPEGASHPDATWRLDNVRLVGHID